MSKNITFVYLCADNVWNMYVNENIFHWNLNHYQPQNVDQYIILEVAGHVCSFSTFLTLKEHQMVRTFAIF